jgi:hypothetical protein
MGKKERRLTKDMDNKDIKEIEEMFKVGILKTMGMELHKSIKKLFIRKPS